MPKTLCLGLAVIVTACTSPNLSPDITQQGDAPETLQNPPLLTPATTETETDLRTPTEVQPEEASFQAALSGNDGIEFSIALYEEAWTAYQAGDDTRAFMLVDEALLKLGPEAVVNISEERYQLMESMAIFVDKNLKRRSEVGRFLERSSRAYSFFVQQSNLQGKRVTLRPMPPLPPGKELDLPDFEQFRHSASPVELKRAAGQSMDDLSGVPTPAQHEMDRGDSPGGAQLPGRQTDSIEPRQNRRADTRLRSGPVLAGPSGVLSAEGKLLLAERLTATGHLEEARRVLEQLLRDLSASGDEITESSIRVRQLLASLLESLGDTDGAEQHREWLVAHEGPKSRAGNATPTAPGDSSQTTRGSEALRAFIRKLANSSGDVDWLAIGTTWALIPGEEDRAADALARAKDQGDADGSKEGKSQAAQAVLESSRLARATGSGNVDGSRGKLLRYVVQSLRSLYGPAHPNVREALGELGRVIEDTLPPEGDLDLHTESLTEEEDELGGEHTALAGTRKKISDRRRAQGDYQGAYEVLAPVLSNRRSAKSDRSPYWSKIVIALAELLGELGEPEAGIALLTAELPDDIHSMIAATTGNSDQGDGSESAGTETAGTEPSNTGNPVEAAFDKSDHQAHQLMAECDFQGALEIRRDAVERHRKDLGLDQTARTEALLELAAVLRALGRTDEARVYEAEARITRGSTEDLIARLARLTSVAKAALPEDEGPAVTLTVAKGATERTYRVAAEIKDVAGIERIDIQRDGLPLFVPLDEDAWTLGPRGERGRVSFDVEVTEDLPIALITVSAVNGQGVPGAAQSILIE